MDVPLLVDINIALNRQRELFIVLFRSTIDHVKSLVSEHGSDCWWTHSIDELLPKTLIQQVGD